MSFKSLGVAPSLVKATTEQEYLKPTPIQEQAIPVILEQKDVLGIAQTGSGKTAAYVLPVLQNLDGRMTAQNRHISVLILVPTRELAVQVADIVHTFGKALPFPFKSLAVFGGAAINPQMKALQNVNVLIATPGRVLELSASNAVHFSDLHTLVLDEADKMLNMGFKKELDELLQRLPRKRQNLLFSATLSPDVQKMERVLLKNPTVIKIEVEAQDISLINQQAYAVTLEKKGPLLRYLIKTNDWQQVLVFTSSVYQADLVADKLKKNGIDATAIHSKKSQGSRTDSLTKFKAGNLRVLVATDLLSRGIDIAFLPHVVNYELPRSPKDFVHRIGRTGRAENPGTAITFVTEEDQHHFKVIQKKMKCQIPVENAGDLNLQGH